jgi:hypothetical protein
LASSACHLRSLRDGDTKSQIRRCSAQHPGSWVRSPSFFFRRGCRTVQEVAGGCIPPVRIPPRRTGATPSRPLCRPETKRSPAFISRLTSFPQSPSEVASESGRTFSAPPPVTIPHVRYLSTHLATCAAACYRHSRPNKTWPHMISPSLFSMRVRAEPTAVGPSLLMGRDRFVRQPVQQFL